MFANTQLGGLDVGGPDICLTPAPPAPNPVPLPYPNVAIGPMGSGAVGNVLFQGGPSHTLATTVTKSNGDNPGQARGLASGTVMGTRRHLTGAFTVLIRGAPASRVTSVALQNSTNCPGACVAPSQTKVLMLAP